MREGILAAGNWIIDQIKVIDTYPGEEALANISEQFSSNGGCAYNVLKDLYMLGAGFPLEGLGIVGADENGDKIIADCVSMGININGIKRSNEAHTSYTDVMSVAGTGRRTFFHQRGANALLDVVHFEFTQTNCKIFHLGYLLLLDKLDIIQKDATTGAAVVLEKAQKAGLITSVDLVSEDSYRFSTVVPPCLPYVDLLFVNEFELSRITGVQTIIGNEEIQVEACYKAAESLLAKGVHQWVVVHFWNGALAVHKGGGRLYQSAIALAAHQIAGAVGAGDAFAAGVLMGVHNNWEMQKCLELGVASACSSLFHVTPSNGIKKHTECLQLIHLYGLRKQQAVVAG